MNAQHQFFCTFNKLNFISCEAAGNTSVLKTIYFTPSVGEGDVSDIIQISLLTDPH